VLNIRKVQGPLTMTNGGVLIFKVFSAFFAECSAKIKEMTTRIKEEASRTA
jgi:hypothetical protein